MRRRASTAAPAAPDLDRHLVELLCRLADSRHPDLQIAIALLCQRVRDGDVCVQLDAEAGAADSGPAGEAGAHAAPAWRDRDGLLDTLRASALVSDGSKPTPLVLDRGNRLYFYRYWQHEQRIFEQLELRARQPLAKVDPAWLRQALPRLFPPSLPAGTLDWQQVAAVVALLRPLCVISGGPGTGKTHTVTKILALLVEQALAAGQRPPRLTLLAPTGKAAQRLVESVRAAKAALACSDEVRAALPEQASTVHRALGALPGQRTRFRHGPDHPLPTDAVLVDEASMVDVGLMARLVGALPASARLILLGDRDQLSSVEAGAVLGDICNSGRALAYSRSLRQEIERCAGMTLPDAASGAVRSAVGDSIVTLRHSYRHAAGGDIGELAALINTGDADGLLTGLRSGRWSGVQWLQAAPDDPCPDPLLERAEEHYTRVRDAASARQALQELGRFRVLCALRRGPTGAERINALLERSLLETGRAAGAPQQPGWPLIVTGNDYGVQLFNGDVGVLWPDSAGALRAVFEGGAGGELRELAQSWLPGHEAVYAMTVHKSQGSEFDRVAVVLPAAPSPLLTVELLYTAVTRARSALLLVASEEILRFTLSRRVRRHSGLRAALWGEPAAIFP
ncbi:MAG: exodeoxyribonuclease V subunit alpha [Deltaproteobacteria bacterium]|nr:exodeoxyribonuclease V subunit alpha [Deltaproteobacteria bacterium]